MSYILDALKKSEQERGHGNIPDVQTIHSSSLNYRNETRKIWPYILIAAVSLNLLAITYFIISKETPDRNQAVTQVTDVTPAAEEKSITGIRPEAQAEPAQEIADTNTTADQQIKNTPVASKPVLPMAAAEKKTVAHVENNTSIVDFHELPESIKQQLPTITISAHVYSSNPLLRSIVINNNFMEEGEYVLDGLILYEITPDGAIFNYQGTIFNYGVVSGWQ
ncbi:MAG: general secretion pathway protein GspB [Gammaproteobacteria bacterium]|nr:general secretion pathway protein GspB [Gammaproteobacteria bacterium]